MADLLSRLRTALADRYRVERELGRGGMARVFLAEEQHPKRHVAIKVLDPEIAAVLGPERFLREVDLASKLTHPHILPIYSAGESDGLLYYAMPYVEGQTLRDRLTKEKQLPVDDGLQIAREVADALSFAHSRDVIHRDIKPENILLQAGHAVVADFGIARAINAAGGDRLTETGVTLGTPPYMSPEQAAGDKDLDGRSDLYALGCVLYEMLAGQPPFTGPTAESVIRQHLGAEPPSITGVRPAVPASVAAALQRALAKTPADRFNPVALFGEALRGSQQSAPPVSSPRSERSRMTRVSVVAGVIATLAVTVLLVLAVRGFPGGDDPVPSEREWVVVADFDGPADDPTLALAVRDLVAATFEQSRAFATVPPDHLARARRAALIPDTARLSVEAARHLASRTAVHLVVEGNVSRVGMADHYAVVLRVLDVTDGAVLAAVDGAATEADIIERVPELARQLGSALNRPGSPPSQAGSLSDVITPSFEAYRMLVMARERLRQSDPAGAARFARQALAMDPDFASAWNTLALAFFNLDKGDSNRWALQEALRRPERLTRREYVMIAASLAPDIDSLLHRYESILAEFPQDPAAHNGRGLWLQLRGRHEEALESFRRAIDNSPLGPSMAVLTNYGAQLATQGHLDQAREVIGRITGPVRVHLDLIVALCAGEWSRAESLATAIEGDATQPANRRTRGPIALASVQAARGEIGAARESLRRAQAMWQREGLASGFTDLGDLPLALASGTAASTMLRSTRVDTTVRATIVEALQAVRTGDTLAARRLLRGARGQSDEPERAAALGLTTVDAALAAQAGSWQSVVELLGPGAWRGEHGFVDGNLLIDRWLVGEAYEALGRLDSAVAYFQLMASPVRAHWHDELQRGLVYSFAHQRLVILYSQMGRIEDARRHYKIFADTFTNPDPEVAHLVDEAREALREAERRGG